MHFYFFCYLLLFTGQWLDDEKHGKGVLKYAFDGTVYDGGWVDDKKCGYGVYTSHADPTDPEYQKYSGDYLDGLQHGHGLLQNNDSSTYEGQFAEGKYNGHGRYTFANGDVYTGE